MKACKLKNDKVTMRLPIHKGMLAIIIKRVQRTYNAINQPLLSTMISTAYFGLFQISKIAKTPSGHAALVNDIQIVSNKNKFLFILRSSKTHRVGSKLQIVKISMDKAEKKLNDKKFKLKLPCPYQLLRNYIRM